MTDFRPRRHLVEHGEIEISIDSERERARDGRRRHREQVRSDITLGRELLAVHRAEAMLFVDDDIGEIFKGERLLDERVRAYHDRYLAVRHHFSESRFRELRRLFVRHARGELPALASRVMSPMGIG